MSNASTKTAGLKITRVFSDENVHPFDQIEWAKRTAEIKDETGKAVFKQVDCDFPESYSQLAVNVIASKYFYGDAAAGNGSPADGKREFSMGALVSRVADTIAEWGEQDGYFASIDDAEAFRQELTWLCVNQYGAFNSPVWFNVGLWNAYGIESSYDGYHYDKAEFRAVPVKENEAYKRPQASACFIVGVGDSIPEIYERAAIEGRIFKYGSGCGSNNSAIRSSREVVRGGGNPSGPLSFMTVYDSVAKVTKSGGKCLSPKQLVLTERGGKTAGELAESGEEFVVLSYSNRLQRVAAKRAQAWWSTEKPMVEVTTDKGVFSVSSDHPFVLRTGEAVEARSLQSGQSLLASYAARHSAGYHYIRSNLKDKNAKRLLHRMVAEDIMGLKINRRVVHHLNHDIHDNRPENLQLLSGQAEHAGLHGREMVVSGTHVFQTQSFAKAGQKNGMHKSGSFWNDTDKASEYREVKSKELKDRGTAKSMQKMARKQAMMLLGYKLINAGHDIETFDGYCRARKATGHVLGVSREKQTGYFVKHFGSYEGFYQELRKNNHKVVSVIEKPSSKTVSIEVFDDEPDDRRNWSEHNYAILPEGAEEGFGSFVFVLNTRRAAKMEILDDWHPDIMEFIRCKGVEEAKAHALIREGYESNFNGEAYSTVCFQNSNMSVRCSDDFMCKVDAIAGDKSWQTRAVTTGTAFNTRGDRMPTYDADEIFDEIATGTWKCGDPGVHFTNTIQKWHTCKATGPINACNPCSEYVFLDNSACNLSSLNLLKFLDDAGTFDVDRFKAACKTFFVAQEILVDRCGYPTEKICQNSHDFRPLGLGYCNLGALLMSLGLPYDSEEGRGYAAAITAIMHGQANYTSARLAEVKGPFVEFDKNRDSMLDVMSLHRDHAYKLSDATSALASLKDAAERLWDKVLHLGKSIGFRNAQATLLAPTGTIGFMMDAATTGVEPDISLVKYKVLAGGGNLRYVNTVVPSALKNLGYREYETAQIVKYIDENDTIDGAAYLEPGHLPIFDCAFPSGKSQRSIAWKGHVDMMAAVQPFLSGAISKTCNVPESFTVKDIRDAYIYAWKRGLKCVAIYRDGSKSSQPLSTKAESKKDDPTPVVDPKPLRKRLPDTRRSTTHKFEIQGHEGYVTVGFYPSGEPGELFVTMSKEGSTIGGLMDAWATAISLGLQYGVPLDVIVEKFAHSRFEPSGFTRHESIRIATSLTDYIVRWLGVELLDGYREANSPNHDYDQPEKASTLPVLTPTPSNQQSQFAKFQSDAPLCGTCGSITVRNGSCYRCFTCGDSLGCS